jgi:DNA-directed RNA polymerase subunit RPC12/RpoP
MDCLNNVRTWINVFDPEYKNLDCPQCHLRRIYFDREIGFYCMSCGQKFSTEEIVILIEKADQISQPIQTPDKIEKKPPLEIREVPHPKAKEPEQTSRDVSHHDHTERD